MAEVDESIFWWIHSGLDHEIADLILIPWRNSETWIPLYLILTWYFFRSFGWTKGLILVLASLTLIGVTDTLSSEFIKEWVQRPRPCHDASSLGVIAKVHCGGGYSFTSTHAMNHMALAIFWCLMLKLKLGQWTWLLIGWGLTVCLAQVYVGVHYPSDVIVGGLIGSSIGGLFGLGLKKWFFRMEIKGA